MDSFLAAANNLDHLLDELEEKEDKDPKSPVARPSHADPAHKMAEKIRNSSSQQAGSQVKVTNGEPSNAEEMYSKQKTPRTWLTEEDDPIGLPSSNSNPGNGFVVIESSHEEQRAATNVDLLINVFGVTAPIADKPSTSFSPLNPFIQDLCKSQGNSSNINTDVTGSMGSTQTSLSNSELPGIPAASSEDKPKNFILLTESLLPTECGNKPECNDQSNFKHNNPFLNDNLYENSVKSEFAIEDGDHELDTCSGPTVVADLDVGAIGTTENMETVSNSIDAGFTSADKQCSPEYNPQGRRRLHLSDEDRTKTESKQHSHEVVCFPKEVAVSQEEFEHFWNDLENGGTRGCESVQPVPFKAASPKADEGVPSSLSVSTTETETGLTSHSAGQGPKLVQNSESAAANSLNIDMEASSSNPADDPTTSAAYDAGDGDIHDEMLITQQEFERFLSEEGRSKNGIGAAGGMATQPCSVATLETAVRPESMTLGEDENVAGDMSAMEVSVSVDTDAAAQTDHPSRLNVDCEEANESDLSYPETPPPPYTQEMHETYENHLQMSPQHRQRPDSGQPPQVGIQEVALRPTTDTSQPQEDDSFSFLPSAIRESIVRPGETKPEWVPDHDAPQCSNCAAKFTFTRRRHHCRACGRVFCTGCCNMKSQLKYLDYKEARVCSMCNLAIMQADAFAEMAQRSAQARPAVPIENASQASENMEVDPNQMVPPPVEELTQDSAHVLVPSAPVGEEAREDDVSPGSDEAEADGEVVRTPGRKSVRFSDGTRPKHPEEMPSTPPPPSRMNRFRRRHGPHNRDRNSPDGFHLPPIIIAHGEGGTYAVEENPDVNVVAGLLESGGPNPQSFVLNPNLIAHVKILSYANRQCWCCWTEGMDGVGQREITLLLEREGLGDRQLPQDAFTLFGCVFDRARKGKVFNTTDFMPMTMLGMEDGDEMFGNRQNAGFLFVQVTSQPLDHLECLKKRNVLNYDLGDRRGDNPLRSMLFAVLVQRTEAPWATLFPMRLMLRLGMEMKQYPCPLFSVRKRQPVYHQLGHTIMAILCDFRNFKYRVMSVPGLRVCAASSGGVSIQIPCNRFSDTVKIMNSSNESVLAMGTGTFGPKFTLREDIGNPADLPCDSHLVCVQDGLNSNYHTEVMCMKGSPSTCTGAAFVIFNGSLKSDGNHSAKCAIVEDGIMVQLLPEKMEELRASLRSMEDFSIPLQSTLPVTPGNEVSEEPDLSEMISGKITPTMEVRWVEDDTAFNIGMFSPIDGTAFEGVVGFNVQGRSEQKGRKHTLRWNQVFFLASASDPLDMSRLAEQVANGCFLALTPVLQELARHRQHKVSIRVTIHPENVGYVAGSRCEPLPPVCMNALDENLIPTIHNAAANVPAEQEAVIIELLFSILLLRPGYRTA